MKAREALTSSTLRLILAALKDRDIAARGKGNADGIGEAEILAMLQSMIKQRGESIPLYEQGGAASTWPSARRRRSPSSRPTCRRPWTTPRAPRPSTR